MKKIFVVLTTLVLGFVLVACTKKDDSKEIKVAVAFYPMGELLELIKDDLKNDGYELKVTTFNNDYVLPNQGLKNKEFDANMIQHQHFMNEFNSKNDASLTKIMSIYHAIFALYSKDLTNPADIPNEATISIPNDSTNLGRALHLLQDAKLLTLKENVGPFAKITDIVSNPKNLKFSEVALNMLSKSYKETGLAIMYPTYARDLNLVGDEQRIFNEDITSSRIQEYAISLVARDDNKDSDKIKALKNHLSSKKVRDYLIDNYSWASTPAF
ncbi:MetQ/NlpA family ABC transporter substrate-binding protein [Haploplasma axanthum]|uniref:D-methionine-binding lipoprotein metQ n=1 Tax=Haploplasma axanthum TaxID=29552 RepID=A0A449BE60_HAPAX|nr:MetQ/NlpA family ABC transporter substrate-binding protein [Haploplasma axanthum]VEU80744.1 D-methionine-binding lipoprotein metQ precursor [Haploplasma axanthum]